MTIGVSRAPYAAFKTEGQRVGGEIIDFRIVQKTDVDSKRPMYFEQNAEGRGQKSFRPFAPDGKPNDPITQWEITVETGVADEDGDSERRLIIDPRRGAKGTVLEGKRGLDAITKALKQARAHRVGLEIGGKLFMTFHGKVRVGSGPETGTWSAEYEPPAGGPGSGQPCDEMPWLIGGGRYDKAAELEKWEKSQMPALQQAVASASAAQQAPAQPATEPAAEKSSIWPTNHESSRVVQKARAEAAKAYDTEPPF